MDQNAGNLQQKMEEEVDFFPADKYESLSCIVYIT